MILGVTLARGGSKGVPGKHTRMLGDKPVIAWTIDEVKKSTLIDEYYVSTDDDGIFQIAARRNVPVIIRPPELCLDTTPTIPALRWTVEQIEKSSGKQYDYIVEIRATSPFKTFEDIDSVVQLLTSSSCEAVIGVAPLEDHHPRRAKYLDENGYIKSFLPEPENGRRQDLKPKAYIRNGTIYAFRRDTLMREDAVLFGHDTDLAYVMPEERSVNIDTELDFRLCEAMLEHTAY